MGEWLLLVRDEALQHIGVVEDDYALEAVERHLGLGAWKVEVAADGPGAELLRAGAGVLLVDSETGETLVSGPIRPQETQRAVDGYTLTVSGVTDTALLSRLCWPKPGQDIPDTGATQDDAYYVVAGEAETVMLTLVDVNAGSSAREERQVPGLVVPASQDRGPVIESKTRFDNLLDVLWGIGSVAGLGVRVVQQGSDLVVDVYEPVDRSDEVRFGVGLGNLAEYTYSLTPPEVTDIVVGIGGEGQARVFYRFIQRDVLWPDLVVEEFVDRRDVDPDADPLDPDYVDPDAVAAQSAAERFAEAGGKASVEFVPIDTDAVRWGRDYWLGDVVTAETEIGPVTDVIREVRYTRSAEDGQRVEPLIGEPQDAPAIYKRVARLRRDVDQLQTRR